MSLEDSVQEPARAKKKHELPQVKAAVPEQFRHWAEKVERGGMKAAVALKCLDCCNWQRTEVAACEITACSLHHVRPYGRAKKREAHT